MIDGYIYCFDVYLTRIRSGLWGFLAAWRSLFDRFDTDGSGNISYDEFTNALSGKEPWTMET